MKKILLCFIWTLPFGHLFAQLPASPKKPVTDTYFGMPVTDNYRWLENTKDTVIQAF